MKTIAISIDEASLVAIDRLARAAGRREGRRRTGNRSQLIRKALREFIVRHQAHEREARDGKVLASNRERIEREVKALLGEQAEL